MPRLYDTTMDGLPKLKKVKNSRECGSVIAEAVIAIPLFFFIVFGSVQLMIGAWRALTIQFVASQVLRTVVTGACWNTQTNREEFCAEPPPFGMEGRQAYALRRARQLSAGYGVALSRSCIGAAGAVVCTQPETDAFQPVPAGGLIQVRIEYTYDWIEGVFKLLDHSSAPQALTLEGIAVGRMEVNSQL